MRTASMLNVFVILLIFSTGCVQQPLAPQIPTPTIQQAQQQAQQTPSYAPASSPTVKPTVEATATPSPSSTLSPTLVARVEIPTEIKENCVGFLVSAPEEALSARAAGAGWLRPHPGPFVWGQIEKTKGEFDFTMADDFVLKAQENRVAILATVWPFAEWDQNCAGGARARDCEIPNALFYPQISSKRCKPCDFDAYKNFLAKLVERFDGDRVDDLPGLEIPVKYWEVSNEPEMSAVFFKGTPQDYAELLKQSSEAIRGACADCKVVQGGAANAEPSSLEFWRSVLKAGGAQYFDVANIHFISLGDEATLNVKEFKEMLSEEGVNKPIWVTEAEFRDASADVKKSFLGALDAGASKVFFVSFKVGGHQPAPPGEFAPAYAELPALCK